MKKKLLASLVLTLALSSCSSVGQTPPSSFYIPQALDTTIGSDGCPIEEPCIGYEAEEESMSTEEDIEAQAWATFDSYNFAPQNLPYPIQYMFMGEASVSDTEDLQPGFWTIPNPTYHDMVFVFQSVALTVA